MTEIRPTITDDAPALLRMAGAEPLFSSEDAAAVDELLAAYLNLPDHGGYFFLSAADQGLLLGFACYGPTPLTQGTFDLYWICVDQSARRLGVGRRLIVEVEAAVRVRGGRMIVLDTSGRADYAPTRAFYEHAGFRPTATVPDFYAPGDDLIVYSKVLA